MPPEPPLPIVAVVRDDERDLILAAANRLSLCLGDGPPPGRPIRLRFAAPDAAPPVPAAALIASLRIDQDARSEPLAELSARWHARVACWQSGGAREILLVNIFRHVADADVRPLLTPHLRRLNLLAVDLSRATGAAIVDLDRVMALVGARALASDYRCGGVLAGEVAAHAIVAGLLGAGLDGHVEAANREAAIRRNDALAAANLTRLGSVAA